MMNRKRKLAVGKWQSAMFLLGLVFSALQSNSQEVLTDLTGNPVLAKKYYEIKNNSSAKFKPVVLDTIPLPFLDDFSKDDVYPDAGLWLDSNVFINRDYPITPPTLGAATFDGVSKSGCPYDTVKNNPTSTDTADVLTSKPINLALLASDSVYLSFYWQAEGRGNDPESVDTLLLDFRNPVTGVWTNVWYKKGYNPSGADTVFHLVNISITDSAYLKEAFQFRFRNNATTSGNVDHWHIDYVLLDKNRSRADTVFSDVAFAYNCPTLLKNYYAMPWRQYVPAEMKNNFSLFIRNNDTVQKNTSFGYKIYNNTGGTETTYSGGNDNCPPFITGSYWNNPAMSNPPIATTPYSYPALNDTASFTVECALNTTPDKDRWNDTVRFKQNFYNYYAYDDGTVEAGYGLNVYGGQMAYKFTLNTPDTLVAVQMLFNWMAPKVSQRQFQIRVWADNGGVPGTMIYEDSLVSPKYQFQFHNTWGNVVNMFYPYMLTFKQPLPSGTFYVGLIQYCCNGSNELINIGYDKNTNSQSKMFYNTTGTWNQTALAQKGSWMIRPVFGDTAGILSVNEHVQSSFEVFPNPSTGQFQIQSNMVDGAWKMADVYNIYGEKVYSLTNLFPHSLIDISHKPNGIYFLRISDEKGNTHSQKLILAK